MADRRSAYVDALYMLGRRELSVAECRTRLRDREHPPQDIDAAVERLIASGALNDLRVARAFVRTAAGVKGRGRLRIQRELEAKGIARDVAAEAIADSIGEEDEGALVARAASKRLRGRTTLADRAESARLYQYLMRQGFTPSAVMAELRRLRTAADDD